VGRKLEKINIINMSADGPYYAWFLPATGRCQMGIHSVGSATSQPQVWTSASAKAPAKTADAPVAPAPKNPSPAGVGNGIDIIA
jgi:hypothetical protein